MKHISITEASELTGRDRSAIGKTIKKIGLKSVPGDDKREKLYNSARLLRALYLDDDGGISYAEALRKLVISKHEKVELENKKLSGDTYTRATVMSGNAEMLAVFRGSLLALEGKVVTAIDIDHIFDNLREIAIAFLPESERPAARRELCHEALNATASRIEFLRKELARNDWHRRCDEKLAILRAAYSRTLNDKSEAAFAALEQARAEVKAAMDGEPGRPKVATVDTGQQLNARDDNLPVPNDLGCRNLANSI